jgi:hypothetical protein
LSSSLSANDGLDLSNEPIVLIDEHDETVSAFGFVILEDHGGRAIIFERLLGLHEAGLGIAWVQPHVETEGGEITFHRHVASQAFPDDRRNGNVCGEQTFSFRNYQFKFQALLQA